MEENKGKNNIDTYARHRRSMAKDFRDFADGDYISARVLYRNNCRDQFLYIACNALEKYLKSIILYNGIKYGRLANSGVHDLSLLYKKCKTELKNFCLSDESESFIEKIRNYNNTRYPDFPFRAEGDYLLYLDKIVWELRFYAQESDVSSRITKEDIENLKSRRGKNKGNRISGGYLERVLKNSNNKHVLERKNLVWSNFYFGYRKKQTIKFQRVWWAKNNHMFTGGEKWQLEVYNAIKEYIPVSAEVKKYLIKIQDKN